MTRIFWMTVIGSLLVLGCGEKGGQTVQESQSTPVKAQDGAQPIRKSRAAETETPKSAEKREVDPALKDYIYPGSEQV
ncbi:MAG: hypothetical protein R3231_11130, partial [bacterium]|nr:hypothetical protein [bacterium]